MIARTNQVSSFAILGERREDLPQILSAAFQHKWVASYQVGFGPPLIKSSPRITERIREARTALEKLKAYVEVCLLDEEERARLAALHRKLVVRRSGPGPIEAEVLDAASADVLDLSLRLHIPSTAPELVRKQMSAIGVDMKQIDHDTPPDVLSGRFLVKLQDPMNRRLLHIPEIAAQVKDPEAAVALDLRIPVALRPLWTKFLARFAQDTGYAWVDMEEPASHARVSRDGARN